MDYKKSFYFLLGVGVLLALYVWYQRPFVAEGAVQPGLAATVENVKIYAVGPQVNTLIFDGATTTSNNCGTRVISTQSKAIMLKFGTTSEGVVAGIGVASGSTSAPFLSGNVGFVQAASTTVGYDGSVYGCLFVGAYGFDSTTTITVMETR